MYSLGFVDKTIQTLPTIYIHFEKKETKKFGCKIKFLLVILHDQFEYIMTQNQKHLFTVCNYNIVRELAKNRSLVPCVLIQWTKR